MTDQVGNHIEVGVGPRITPVARITSGLREQERRIIANWAVRVTTLPVFRAIPSLGLDELQHGIPALLDAALNAVELSDRGVADPPLDRARDIAAQHATERRELGFELTIVLAELQALRAEIWAALWRMMERAPNLLGSLREVEARLNDTFDALALAAAEAWGPDATTTH